MLNDNFFYSFSGEAQNEIYDYIKALHVYNKLEEAKLPDSDDCPTFKREVEEVRNELENGKRIVIVKPFIDLHNKYTIQEQRTISWLIGNVLGEALVQNEAGEKAILVFDRDRKNSMAQGARYHQTREGGTIHTDNVNVPFVWEYLVLACISPAMSGGENILVNGLYVHKILKEKHSDVLAILEKNFCWEQRGVADATYEAPVISYNQKGEPVFRHLRPYMESAHQKMNRPLTDEQMYALDTLDSILEHSDNQYRHSFKAGEILLTYDSQVLHGRTCFSDAFNALTIHDWKKDHHRPLKRTMDRLWIKKQ
ncbi:MAG: TauD/TfdA family dioxygenase [Bacteriovorax sp.]|jgi:alpha-ketoglutarate-dependent taurine dioxygenase|nr:TauD/TfdA family dioxygenase [Bacteriovorax sp.]